MAIVTVPGSILSALAFALLGYLLRDVLRRRGRFPSLTYGGRAFRQRTLALLWGGGLVTSFVLGLGGGAPVFSRTVYAFDPIVQGDTELRSDWSVAIPLPFLRYTIVASEVLVGDPPTNAPPVWHRATHGELKVPLLFLVAAGFYWLAVMRWREESGRPPATADVGFTPSSL